MTQAGPIVEERVTLAGPAGPLSGVLSYPAEAEPAFAALVCSPHPHFAGDMDNNVVRAVAARLAAEAVALRFDYRGVGDSAIELPAGLSVWDYWDQVEQHKAYDDALADVACAAEFLSRSCGPLPAAAVGYSFGAITAMLHGRRRGGFACLAGISPPLKRFGFEFLAGVARPCLLLSGREDFVFCEQALARARQAAGGDLYAQMVDGDHFFRGREDDAATRVADFIRDGLFREGTD